MQKNIGEYGFAFLMGFFLYTMMEIMGRGYTHWTMGIAAGVTMSVLYHMEDRLSASRLTRALLGGLFVTAAEFTVGVFDNIIMGWQVWDYSGLRFQLFGQVSLLFSLLWCVLCYFAVGFCDRIWLLFHEVSAGAQTPEEAAEQSHQRRQ